MVGGLVQKENVAVAAEYARQGNAHPLSAGKLADGLLQVSKAQLGEDRLRFISGGSGVLTGTGGQVLQRSLGDGGVLTEHRRLRQIGNGHVPLHGNAAFVRLFQTCQKAQEGAFAAAVLAHHAYTVTVGNGQGHVVHQHLLGEEDGHVIEGKCACHRDTPFLSGVFYHISAQRARKSKIMQYILTNDKFDVILYISQNDKSEVRCDMEDSVCT